MTRRLMLCILALMPAVAACGRKGELEPPPKKDAKDRPDERRSGS